MEKKTRNTLIVSVIALALVLIGVTYAYFSARITGLESASTLSLTAGRMGIHYSEDDANVSVSGIYPREQAWITKQVTLTGYNTTNQPMEYELGLQITTNTFKGGQLTMSLTGVGANGTKIADIESKALVGQNRFLKIGTGTFSLANGDTHVYTISIYFKDNGEDQNINQEAVFNAKVKVRDHQSGNVAINDCIDTAHQTLTQGDEYVNGQYTYRYMQQYSHSAWTNITTDGWGVTLTNKDSDDAVTTPLCTSINGKPIVSMSSMFYGSSAGRIDLSSFDTSNVTNMEFMFSDSLATTLDLSSFDTSNVTNMQAMFGYSYATSIIGLSNFDTSNVTDMSNMFHGSNATSIDLSSFDTSKVTNMSNMFYGSNATSIDLSSFDTSNVTSMQGMFGEVENLNNLDLSSFNISNTTNIDYMFVHYNYETTNYINNIYLTSDATANYLYNNRYEDDPDFMTNIYVNGILKYQANLSYSSGT